MPMSQPGPPGQANTAAWRRWLFPGIIAAFFVALLVLPRGAAPAMPLTYTRFLADVGAGMVGAVTIGPAGQVAGTLAGGQDGKHALIGLANCADFAAGVGGDNRAGSARARWRRRPRQPAPGRASD